jgi:hypothetical protein
MTQQSNTHMEVTLLLRLLNPADCLLSRLLIFSGEYGLLGRGGALSHLRCSRSAIVPETYPHKHELDRNDRKCMKLWHRTVGNVMFLEPLNGSLGALYGCECI